MQRKRSCQDSIYFANINIVRDHSTLLDEKDCVSPNSKWFNDREFQIHFCMCCKNFNVIVKLMKESKNFKTKPNRRKKSSVEFHLSLFLQKMG